MKTILVVSLMAILISGVIAPALQEAYALKADTSKKLSPKSFGEKTKNKMSFSEKVKNSGYDSIKEQLKTFKKISEEHKAKKLLLTLYKLG